MNFIQLLLESIEELQVDLDNFMEYYNYQVKISESIRGRKEVVEKNLIFVYDSVINEVKNKEVLEPQFVTTF